MDRVAAATVTLSASAHCSSMSRPCPVTSYHVNIVWLPCLKCDSYAEITSMFVPMVRTPRRAQATDIALTIFRTSSTKHVACQYCQCPGGNR